MRTVPRYDYYSLRPMTVMPHTGFLLCEGVAAKEGVLRYAQPDGTVRRELVTREDTLTASSLATLPLVKFTNEHPDVPVTPANVTKFGKGTVLNEVECHNGFVVVRFVVDDEETIQAIRSDALPELSPGYSVELDETPGVHPVFGAYDAIQIDRVYNHLAGTKAARGGHDIRFRTDSAVAGLPGFAWQLREDTVWPEVSGKPYALMSSAQPPRENRTMAKINLDGIELELPDAAASTVNQWRKDMEEDAAATSAELSQAKELIAAHQAQIDELQKQIDELQATKDKLVGQLESVMMPAPAPEPEAPEMEGDMADEGGGELPQEQAPVMNTDSFLKWHNERKELEPIASRFRVDSVDTLDNPALRRAICEAHMKRDLSDRSDSVIEGIYEGIRTVLGVRDDSYMPAPSSAAPAAKSVRNDSDPLAREARATQAYLERLTKRQAANN